MPEIIMPLPPPVSIPNPVIGPRQQMPLPSFKPPAWEPIPIYRDDVPGIGNVGTTEDNETEEEVKQETEPKAEPKPAPEPAPPPIPEMAEVNTVTIPIINVEMPLPKAEIVSVAVTTAGVAAVASVGGTLVATSMFKQLMKLLKPVMKTVVKKILKARGKQAPSWSRERQAQKYQRLKGPTQ